VGLFARPAVQAEDDETYEAKCRLPDGETVRRIAPPFPEARLAYYRRAASGQAMAIPRGPDAMILRSTASGIRHHSMTFGRPFRLDNLLHEATGIPTQQVFGGEELRKRPLDGDWVFRTDAAAERKLEDLERILREELKLDVGLAFKEVKRPVIVATGTYRFAPRRPVEKAIDIYADGLDPDSGGGGGTGSPEEFFQIVGRWIVKPIVVEAKELPKSIRWRNHQSARAIGETPGEAEREALIKQTLKNLTDQTGLEYHEELRTIKSIAVEEKRGK
jgi:hypothetical protein